LRLKIRKADRDEYTQVRIPGKIAVSDFEDGKIASTVQDEMTPKEMIVSDTKRMQVKATYITKNKRIAQLKIQKFTRKKGVLQPDPVEINLGKDTSDILVKFLQFLTSSDISAVSAGRLSFEQDLKLDADLEQKLKTLAHDPNGQLQLRKIFDEGYFSSDLDIPELIKTGLSSQTINKKKEKLEEFKELINQSDVKEVSDIQTVLKDMPWIFGPEYKSLDFRAAGLAGNPDGRLLRIDKLSDVLEVKLPKAELLREDNTKRQFIAPELAKALGQLTGYLEHYYSEYRQENNDETKDEIASDTYGRYYKPKGILLIGRRSKEDGTKNVSSTISPEPKRLRRLLSYFHWIEVLTYDDLIERARNGLDNLTK
jgi:hypothetical protein